MGASASMQTVVNNIMNETKNELAQKAGASATATCTIKFGRVQFKKTRGCTIKVQNFCATNASATIDSVVEAAFKVFNNLTVQQKEEGAKLFTAKLNVETSVADIKNKFHNYITNNCDASTRLENGITVQDFIVDECVAPPNQIMEFEYVNSGEAKANCGIKTLLKLTADATTEISIMQKSSNVYELLGYILGIGIPVLIFFLLYYCKTLFFTKPRDRIEIELAKHNSPTIGLLTIARGLGKI